VIFSHNFGYNVNFIFNGLFLYLFKTYVFNLKNKRKLRIMAKCECPSCYYEFELEDGTIEGEVIPCPDCGVDLEVTKIDGDTVKVEVAEMTEEDWGE
jgi:alpha-aminoadipate carrier protein LysW